MKVCHTTQPLFDAVMELHAQWVSSRPKGDSIAFAVFFEHLAKAFQVGLAEVAVRSDGVALRAGDHVVVGEWHLSGDLDLLRSTLQAARVDVHAASLDKSVEAA